MTNIQCKTAMGCRNKNKQKHVRC